MKPATHNIECIPPNADGTGGSCVCEIGYIVDLLELCRKLKAENAGLKYSLSMAEEAEALVRESV